MARSRAGIAAQPDFDALKKFSELTDRGDTPFFGGRTDEIATVENALKRIQRRTQEDHWHPAGGETVLFQGAPGAGKSALLYHLAKVWRSSGQNAPVVVNTALTHYLDEGRLALRIAEAVDPEIATSFRHSDTIHSNLSADVGGCIPGAITESGSAELGLQAEDAPLELSLSAVKDTLLDLKRPVVLILDEAQGLECFDAETVLPVISQLHKGSHGGPILTVFAGLAYSSGVLGERGIARFSQGHEITLSALTSEEARQIVLRMLAEFRVRGDKELKNQWAHTLANVSCGWPQHLHVAMQALAVELLSASTPGNLEPVDSHFGSEVLKASAQAREQYYERRIDDELVVALDLVAETLRQIGSGAFRANVLAHIREAARPDYGTKSLPEGHDAEMFLERMIRRGVLQHASGHKLVCPIPALQNYIERLAKRITSDAQFQNVGR